MARHITRPALALLLAPTAAATPKPPDVAPMGPGCAAPGDTITLTGRRLRKLRAVTAWSSWHSYLA